MVLSRRAAVWCRSMHRHQLYRARCPCIRTIIYLLQPQQPQQMNIFWYRMMEHNRPSLSSLTLPSSLSLSFSSSTPQIQIHNDHYMSYKRSVRDILSSAEYKQKKKSMLVRSVWSDDMFTRYEKWLLQREPSVDSSYWNLLSKQWMENATNDDTKRVRMKNQATKELNAQSQALLSKIFPTPDPHQKNKRKTAILVYQAFDRMMTFVITKLVKYCQIRGGEMIPIMWFKMKECGMVMNAKQLHTLPNLVTSSLTNRLEQSTKGDQERLLEEDIFMYHDMLTRGHESDSIYAPTPQTLESHRDLAMLKQHCDEGNVDEAFSLLEEIRTSNVSSFTFDHYILVMAMLVERGQLKLFDKVARGMINQTGSISPSSAKHLHNILVKKAAHFSQKGIDCDSPEDILDRNTPAKVNELLSCRVEIDPVTSVCPVTGYSLDDHSLTREQRKMILDDILLIGEKHSSLVKQLETFSDWLQNREGEPPFTVILDGANVSRLSKMMSELKLAGYHPLVIIPKKIAAKSSPSLTNGSSYIVDDYDDLFCMLATVVKQEGLDRTVMLMTNDKLRDHSREMRDPDVSDLRAHVRILMQYLFSQQ